MRFRVWLIRLTYESLSRCSMSQEFFWWLIIITHFKLAAISMESPPSSRNSDSSPESEEDKDEEIEVIECWRIFVSHTLWFIIADSSNANDDASNLTMTKQSITNSIYNLNHWYLLSLFYSLIRETCDLFWYLFCF